MFKPLYFLAFYSMFMCGIATAQDKKTVDSAKSTEVKPAEAKASLDKKKLPLNAGRIKLGDGLIVPGQRVGPVILGTMRKEVEAILGVPVETVKMDDELNYSTWRWEQQPQEQGDADFFVIIFQKDRVVQIETNASAFALPNGLSIQSPAADWTRLWGSKPERRTVMMSIVGTPRHLTWRQVGFALRTPWESVTPGDYPIQRVIVLPKNQSARTTFSLLRSLRAMESAKSQSAAK